MAKLIQPLSNFNVLNTEDLDAARAAMASIYGDVTLNPVGRNSSFSMCLNAVPVGRLLITSHRWGAGVDAKSPSLHEYFTTVCATSCGVPSLDKAKGLGHGQNVVRSLRGRHVPGR